MVSPPSSVSVVVTCWRRPQYLERTLRSWRAVRGIEHVRKFIMACGVSMELPAIADVIMNSGLEAEIHMDSPAARASFGMHRALGEAIDHAFADPFTNWVICGEEDIMVSDDVLEYFTWAFRHMTGDLRILAACAHNRGGTGWDKLYLGPQDAGADPEIVRAVPYYHPWVWAVSRYNWQHTLRSQWDWDCDSGGADDSGYDWNIQKRVLPRGDWLCLVPDASRSQNIGEHGGVNSSPDIYLLQRSDSFELHRDRTGYKLLEET